MIAVERPAAPALAEPAILLGPRAVRRKRAPLAIKVCAVAALVAVFVTVDGGWLFNTGSALVLQSRGAALHAYWALMRAAGVPGDDLARLEEEWAGTRDSMVFGAAGAFWWPGASAMVNRWQAETDAIWTRSLIESREGALAAHRTLTRRRGEGASLDNRAGFPPGAQMSGPPRKLLASSLA